MFPFQISFSWLKKIGVIGDSPRLRVLGAERLQADPFSWLCQNSDSLRLEYLLEFGFSMHRGNAAGRLQRENLCWTRGTPVGIRFV